MAILSFARRVVNGVKSEPTLVIGGIFLGSVLGPTLFVILKNVLPDVIRTSEMMPRFAIFSRINRMWQVCCKMLMKPANVKREAALIKTALIMCCVGLTKINAFRVHK